MRYKYTTARDVPLEVLVSRLNELSAAVPRGDRAEFTMRVPVELDRDADVVLSEAADRLASMDKRVAEAEREVERLRLHLAHTQRAYRETAEDRLSALERVDTLRAAVLRASVLLQSMGALHLAEEMKRALDGRGGEHG